MSSQSCERCRGYGTTCRTCGRWRNRKSRPGYGTDGDRHRRCARRPKGVIDCPDHFETELRCDMCGLKVPYYAPGDLAHLEKRKDWGTSKRGDGCPTCTIQLEVVMDAVGGLDLRELGERAVANLVAALDRLDAGLPEHLRPSVVAALRRALARLQMGVAQ